MPTCWTHLTCLPDVVPWQRHDYSDTPEPSMPAAEQFFISILIETLGGILWDLVKDIMLIKGLDTGVAEHQLANAGILPGELGTHQAPQVVRLGLRQPDLHRVSLDNLPSALAGKGLSREPGVYVLSA